MKKYLIFLFGFLLFAQNIIFAMDCCMEMGDNKSHSDSKHQEVKMSGKDIVVNKAKDAENVGNTICPVTGEKIDEKNKATFQYEGKVYNFCCLACVDEFKKDPAKFIKKIEEETRKKEGKMDMSGTDHFVKSKDPVCGMEINSNEADATSVYEGKTYYFCSKECKTKFDKDPKKYIIKK